MTYNPNTGIENDMNLFSKEIKISYKGPVDGRILTVVGDYIEAINPIFKIASKKMFNIFFELTQNISYYSAQKIQIRENKEIGSGSILIKETDKHFVLVTGNPVFNENIIPVIEKCEYINSLDRESLRKYKRDERRRPQGKMGNAHIGLIKVALTSTNPLDVEVSPLNDDISYFSIAVKINK